MADDVTARRRNRIVTGPFVAALVVLIGGTVGIRPLAAGLAKRYSKEPIALRRPLRELDVQSLPSFRTGWQVRHVETAGAEVGTTQYLQLKIYRGA